jgi:hypothetical protein
MTESHRPATGPFSAGDYSTRTGDSTRTDDISGWVGWVVFAGLMLIMLGFFQAIVGLVAIFDQGFYLVSSEGLTVNVGYSAWGWLHFAIGVIAVVAGLGLFMGNMAARIVGVVVAIVSAVLNLAFIAAYPVWSTIVIAVDIIVIYAIVVHGRELQPR